MNMRRADVIVVGAGPAGAVSALLLARAGCDVVIADRAQFPRAKPCGDCISPPANLLLEQLGLWPAITAAAPAHIAGWRIIADDGSRFEARFDRCASDPRLQFGLAIIRERFDQILLQAAIDAGATYLPRLRIEQVIAKEDAITGVSARTSDGEVMKLHARFTIGADGLRSIMRRRLALSGRAPRLRKVAFCTHVAGVRELDDFGEMHLHDGWCVGLAPVDRGRGLANLTLVANTERHGRSFAGKNREVLHRALQHFKALQGRLPPALGEVEWRSCGPFDWPARSAVTRGAALVGDAAGYYDPFTGQGIYHALWAAQQLARAVDHALRDRTEARPLTAYNRRIFVARQQTKSVQQLIEQVCARPMLARRSIAALSVAPRAAHRLVEVTGDLAPAHSLLSPAALLSFLVAFSARSHS